MYVPVVGFQTQDDNNLLEQLKTGFKRKTKWNKNRSEMAKQTKTNNLIYLIDPAFCEVNRLFMLSFENEEDRTAFSEYYTQEFEIKDFNVLIDDKRFFDAPIRKKEETYKKDY